MNIEKLEEHIIRIEKQGDIWYIIPKVYSYGGSGKTIQEALEKFVHNNNITV